MSLPLPGVTPPPIPRAPNHSLGNISSPRRAAAIHLRPTHVGPVLHVTVVAADVFGKADRFYLSVASAKGEERRTSTSTGSIHDFNERFNFAIEDDDVDFELRIAALSEQLPQLSPRGVMANVSKGEPSWGVEVGRARLTLSEMLSSPQIAGAPSKLHSVSLTCKEGRPVGIVTLDWSMVDKCAEAREAAERAADLSKQKRAAENQATARRKAAAERHAEERIRIWQASQRQAALDALEQQRQAEADAFDRAMDVAKKDEIWETVLDCVKVVLWLPDGVSIPLSARQAVGLSDAAASSKSGMVAFIHDGMKVTLNGAVARTLRQRVEAKMGDQSSYCEPILVATTANVTRRASTAASAPPAEISTMPPGTGTAEAPTVQAREESSGGRLTAVPPMPRHLTAPPRPRVRVPHPSSISWLGAAALPLQPSAPRVAPNPKNAAILRAQSSSSKLAEAVAADHGTVGESVHCPAVQASRPTSAARRAISTSLLSNLVPVPPPRVAARTTPTGAGVHGQCVGIAALGLA